MADVKRRAEAEAEKKGLSGAQEQAYVGGVFNRIRQAHARATTPGTHGARRLLKRAARREARAEAQEQIRYHEQQIAGLKSGIHLRAQLDEPRRAHVSDTHFSEAVRRAVMKFRGGSGMANIPEVRAELRKETGLSDAAIDTHLRALREKGDAGHAPFRLHFTEDEERLHEPSRGQLNWRGGNFDFIELAPSVEEQKRIDDNRRLQSEQEEERIFKAHGMIPPVRDLTSDRLLRPATPAKQPATREEQIAEAGGYVPKTPIMELRKLRPRQLTDEQLARDWQSAANWPVQSAGVERRKQALEREMARRREAQAAPIKPVKASRASSQELVPIVSPGELGEYDRDEKPTAYSLQRLYGDRQLRPALNGYTRETLKEMADEVMARNPGTKPARLSKDALIEYIDGQLTKPAQAAQPAAVARPAEKGKAAKNRATRIAREDAKIDEQMRDFELRRASTLETNEQETLDRLIEEARTGTGRMEGAPPDIRRSAIEGFKRQKQEYLATARRIRERYAR